MADGQTDRVLYWGQASPGAWRAMIMLDAKGLSYEGKRLDLFSGEHKAPEVLALNPRGQVPTFKDGDACVNESIGILLYLESQYPDPPLLPSDPAVKATVECSCGEASISTEDGLQVLQRVTEVEVLAHALAAYARPKMLGLENPTEEKCIEAVKAEFALWEGYLGKQKYAATDEFTLADVALAPMVLVFANLGMEFKELPNLKQYADTVKEYPSIAKTLDQHQPYPGIPPVMNIF